jgi:hypothetical protein
MYHNSVKLGMERCFSATADYLDFEMGPRLLHLATLGWRVVLEESCLVRQQVVSMAMEYDDARRQVVSTD